MSNGKRYIGFLLLNVFKFITSTDVSLPLQEDLTSCWNEETFSIFEIFSKISYHFNVDVSSEERHLFEYLKDIVTKLLMVEPHDRMKLEDVYKRLPYLETLTKIMVATNGNNFCLLNPSLNFGDISITTRTDDPTQQTHGRMDEIRTTRLFTEHNKPEFTQRNTYLCVPISAMRLLSYELVEFVKNHGNFGDDEALKELEYTVIAIHEGIPRTSHQFLKQLITICCNVISPRSLNGLNHRHLDDQKTKQTQQIRKLVRRVLVGSRLQEKPPYY